MIKRVRFQRDIYIGVIVAIIMIVFIDPILRLSANIVSWMGNHIYEGISRSLYRSAAFGLHGQTSYLIFASITYIGVIAIAIGSYVVIDLGRSAIKRLRDIKSGESRSIDDIEKDVEKSIRIITIIRFPLVISVVLLALLSFFLVGFQYGLLQLNVSFDQRLAIIRPDISDHESENLQAEWASMHNRRDYLNILSEMDAAAKKNKISLPEPLWK